ncbi:uncharacterized protein LOC118755499 isoform X1 [Rhagoletis pomonella]|uniref:uncharacterized protein LOC118755499 isoform X1 n=2 Tax=Rhagoletis pomonella TaxID=28610 RepID=UPI00177EE4A8|nr:uncharacterized protein LOC118755499 isoform X1 [Rhagoletis pomonella]
MAPLLIHEWQYPEWLKCHSRNNLSRGETFRFQTLACIDLQPFALSTQHGLMPGKWIKRRCPKCKWFCMYILRFPWFQHEFWLCTSGGRWQTNSTNNSGSVAGSNLQNDSKVIVASTSNPNSSATAAVTGATVVTSPSSTPTQATYYLIYHNGFQLSIPPNTVPPPFTPAHFTSTTNSGTSPSSGQVTQSAIGGAYSLLANTSITAVLFLYLQRQEMLKQQQQRRRRQRISDGVSAFEVSE